jgi:hypothetical protein
VALLPQAVLVFLFLILTLFALSLSHGAVLVNLFFLAISVVTIRHLIVSRAKLVFSPVEYLGHKL